MIGRLRGKIAEILADKLLIDVNGVGYEVFVSSKTAASQTMHADAVLMIETHVREDHIHLYGFDNMDEREWFNTLTTVKGVGAKMGLNILGAFAPSQLHSILASKDTAAFKPVSGVGPKLAERLVTELKSKVASLPMGAHSATPAVSATGGHAVRGAQAIANSAAEDAIAALSQLGYNRVDAYQAVLSAMNEQPEATLEELIKAGLRILSS